MGLAKWFRRQGERIEYAREERRLNAIGLSRSKGEREYPRQLGTLEGIAEDHIERYQWALPYCKGKIVLDYGCGVGYGGFVLSESAAEVAGFDISTEALDWARYYAESRTNLKYTSSLPESVFDCVTCFECIEHVPNPDEVLDWLAGHAREYVFISSPDAATSRGRNPHHLREFTVAEFEGMLSSRFTIEDTMRQSLPYNDVMLCRCRCKG